MECNYFGTFELDKFEIFTNPNFLFLLYSVPLIFIMTLLGLSLESDLNNILCWNHYFFIFDTIIYRMRFNRRDSKDYDNESDGSESNEKKESIKEQEEEPEKDSEEKESET